ncbi:MAG: DNA polymerase III subunit gamma/tau [Firmicutes bacterium]|nr:DNA polymerase III subunit gamma/tau [Bacillota bacterium]
MSYLSLYRKWRPQTFEDVAGQKHVTRTLQNALSMNRIAHAYLFCGPRGTGKTTIAKLLAKALNCENGPTPTPCNKCRNCVGVRDGIAMDVFEIDGASNRGIDEIRDLREKVKFAPSEGRYKVYIIDEVHMLTTEAFNALLKTLEEPPAHVIFIFATTEPHKVPATILSRCQRFDFKRISTQEIVDYLAGITAKEGFEVSREALSLIARTAEGGMRDALSILDQSVSFSGQKVAKSDVEALLGVVRFELLQEFAEAMVSGNIMEGLLFVDRLLEEGKDLRQFARDMVGHFRNLMLVKACLEDPQGTEPALLVDVDAAQLAGLKEQARRFDFQAILQGITALSEAEQKIRWAAQERLPMEMVVVKFATWTGSAQNQPTLAQSMPQTAQQLKAKVSKTDEAEVDTLSTPATVARATAGQEAVRADEIGSGRPDDFADMAALWGKLSETLRQEKHSIQQALLAGGRPVGVEGDSLVVGFGPDCKFHMDQLAVSANKGIVEKAIAKVFGKPIQLVCKQEREGGRERERKGEREAAPARASRKRSPGARSPASDDVTPDPAAGQEAGQGGELRQAAPPPARQEQSPAPEDDPVVKKALEIFGAKIVKIE